MGFSETAPKLELIARGGWRQSLACLRNIFKAILITLYRDDSCPDADQIVRFFFKKKKEYIYI